MTFLPYWVFYDSGINRQLNRDKRKKIPYTLHNAMFIRSTISTQGLFKILPWQVLCSSDGGIAVQKDSDTVQSERRRAAKSENVWLAREPGNAISEQLTSDVISSQTSALRINRNTWMLLLWLQKDRVNPLICNYLISRNLKPEKKVINHLDFISILTAPYFSLTSSQGNNRCLREGWISWPFWFWRRLAVVQKTWN